MPPTDEQVRAAIDAIEDDDPDACQLGGHIEVVLSAAGECLELREAIRDVLEMVDERNEDYDGLDVDVLARLRKTGLTPRGERKDAT